MDPSPSAWALYIRSTLAGVAFAAASIAGWMLDVWPATPVSFGAAALLVAGGPLLGALHHARAAPFPAPIDSPPVTVIIAAAGVAAGAALQSATGFGFSLVAAPLLFAAIGPAEAVGSLLVLGAEVNLLALLTERRRPQPLGREAAVLLGWAVPGALAGVAVLRALSPVALQIALTLGVVLTLAARRFAPERTPAWAAPVAGFASGALTTSTSTSGPPLVAYLLGRGHDPARLRDTLVVCFLALSPIGAAALLVTGTSDAVPDLWLLTVLVPVTAIGQIAGRPLFARLAGGGRYESVLTVVLVMALAIGLVGAFTS